MPKNTELVDELRALVALFPGQQHRKCSEWLKGTTRGPAIRKPINQVEATPSASQEPESVVSSSDAIRPLVREKPDKAQPDSSQRSYNPTVGTHPSADANDKTSRVSTAKTSKTYTSSDIREPPGKARSRGFGGRNPVRPSYPSQTQIRIPPFAKEVSEDPATWGQRIVVGKGLSWDEEKRLLEGIERAANFTGATSGFLGGMFALQKDQRSSAGKTIHMELYVPRIQNPRVVLVRLRVENGTARQFEVSTNDVSGGNIQKLTQAMETR